MFDPKKCRRCHGNGILAICCGDPDMAEFCPICSGWILCNGWRHSGWRGLLRFRERRAYYDAALRDALKKGRGDA